MKLTVNHLSPAFGLLLAATLAPAGRADDTAAATQTGTTNTAAAVAPDTRYGLFDGLDHRSFYSQGNFPEPFLVDDSGLEINEARLDWLHTRAGSSHTDLTTAEVEKGFGLLTLEIEVPYERTVNAGTVTQGIGNIDLGARYPFYQYVSSGGGFDSTFGGAFELGIPASSAISVNPEYVPKIFNDTKIGDHFTVQSILGYSTLGGGGEVGGLQTFEYGFTLGYSLDHHELPLPGVRQFIPMFELVGEKGLNKDAADQDSLEGNAGFRVNLKSLGTVQPRLGLGFVFPITSAARTDNHWGIVTSLVFEY